MLFTVMPDPTLTMLPVTKFVPLNPTSSVCNLVPITGLMLVNVGVGLFTVKVCPVDVPPPGPLFVTVKLLSPVAAASVIVRFAVKLSGRCTVVVFTVIPGPTFTLVTPLIKFDPVNPTSSVCSRFPLVGLMLVNVGAGILTVKVCPVDIPPPGPLLVTEKLRAPSSAPALIVMFAVKLSELCTVVVFTVILSPTFTLLTPSMKPEPLNPTSSVCSRVPLVGLMLVRLGAGLLTVKV